MKLYLVKLVNHKKKEEHALTIAPHITAARERFERRDYGIVWVQEVDIDDPRFAKLSVQGLLELPPMIPKT